MCPGCPELREHEYVRHGTLSLIATCNVATGQVLAPALGPTRREIDFAAPWLFLADNLNPHQSETLVRLVAERCGCTGDLGVQGQSGLLLSLASRAAFLGVSAHRIQFLSTLKHTSWLNQIELWFNVLVRRGLKRGNVASTDALCGRILAFIAYCNQTAGPFTWNYKGRPLYR